MKTNQIRAVLDGLGTEQNTLYTNDEMIENLDSLQRALASGLYEATHVECARARDITSNMEKLMIEHGLEATPQFQRFANNMGQLGYTIGSLIKGRTGERNTMKALQLLALDKGIRILYNISIQDGDAQMEYDAIVLAPYGVFVVEVKNYNDSMRITETGMLEKLVNPDFQYNLGGRMNGKEYLLRKSIGGELTADNYHGLLLYANEYSNLVDDYHRVQVCYRNTIVQDIRAYDTGEFVFTDDQLAEMEKKLVALHSPKRFMCKVDCDAIKEDYVFLLGQILHDENATSISVEAKPQSRPNVIAAPIETRKPFSWKRFWCGALTGAFVTVVSVFAISQVPQFRARA